MTDEFPGLTCSQLNKPLPGSNKSMAEWAKIAQLIEAL